MLSLREFRIFLPLLAVALPAQQTYSLGPDSLSRQPGVAAGKLTKHSWNASKIYPGTTRDYWVYAAPGIDPARPAPFMVIQDGGGWIGEQGAFRAPVVLDNLTARKEIPPLVVIFINPGVLPAASPQHQARYNRSYEYDGLGDRYARFLIEEILPEVGKTYKLSADPSDAAIGGSSSGAICAFNAAWQRPDRFRRVLSYIGSYVNLRGGDTFPGLIRKTEPKPLRVFLQDGDKDLNIYSGSWWMANQDVASALAYAGYDHTFVKGTEGHNGRHGGAILPDALRWLWRGYPEPVKASPGGGGERQYVAEIADLSKGWELVSQGHQFTEGPAVNAAGEIYFVDARASRILKLDSQGKVTPFKENAPGVSGLAIGASGELFACEGKAKRLMAYKPDGSSRVVTEGMDGCNDVTALADGSLYFTDPPAKKVWRVDALGNRRAVVEAGIEFPNGVTTSPDQSLLLVADSRSRWVWSYQIQPDGSLANGEKFYHLEASDDSGWASADGLKTDSEGYLYVATNSGVQICDQPGRVTAILNKPQAGPLSNVLLAGQYLYVTAGDKVYRRVIRRTAALPWAPSKPPQPRL